MRRSHKSALAALAATALAAPLAVFATASAASAAPVPPRAPVTDFNHDGYADLAIAAPGGTVAGADAGYVSVVHGSANGPDTAHAQQFSRATDGVAGQPEAGGAFGRAMSVGDLDGDSYTDLVVNGTDDGGAVVLWGSADGLSGARSTKLPTDSTEITTGDFNGDGKRDLVTDDYPDSDDPNNDDAGMTISYGPFTRDGKAASQQTVATSRTFGPYDLVAGDVTGDGADDIVTSHGFEEMAHSSKFWKGGKDGVSTNGRAFTSSLGGAIADVDGDGYGDLVVRDIGDNNEDVEREKGTVLVKYGTASGPSDTRTTTITQDTAGVPGAGETGDQFGAAISAGDVNGDGYADVAVGIPGEDIDAVKDAGSMVLLKGGRGGLSGTGAQAFQQSTAGMPGAAETGDHYGARVLLSDTNGDKKADLTVAAPQEDGTYQDSGAAWVLRGAASGLTTSGVASFGPAALGAPEKGALLGDRLGH